MINKDRYRGSLIGQAIGDAVGCAVEAQPATACKEYVELVLRKEKAQKLGRGRFKFGQYTDDTQLARELLESYVACREFRPADYAARIAAIFSENRIVGRGRATAEAAERLARGVSWEEAGTPSPSAGNGSAMRAGPIGLIFYDDMERLVVAACDQGRITHKDSRCSAGAVAIAAAVAIVLQKSSINAEDLLIELSSYVEPIDRSVFSALRELSDWISLELSDAARFISALGADFNNGWDGISPFVTSSVLWSLYAFLRSPDNYWETICTAIEVGGDVDTTAAMAGAISGAYLGMAVMPMDLALQLNDQNSWRYDELIGLADRCFEIKHGMDRNR